MYSKSQWINSSVLSRLAEEQTTAHRLCSTFDGWIERFGDDLLISYKFDNVLSRLLTELKDWSSEHHLSYARVFAKYLPKKPNERNTPQLVEGDPKKSLQTVVLERGMRFTLDFSAGYSAGLFIDQRNNRNLVRQLKPKRLLNCFAYTCAFSVAAALTGSETMSIDLSKKSLQRGENNFKENNLDISQHRFFAEDVLEMVPRLARQNEKFDMIVLDPPTFSRGTKGNPFQVEYDLEPLLADTIPLLKPKGRVLLSTNCTKLGFKDLEKMARFSLKVNRLSADLHQEPSLPDIPEEFSAKTLWLFIK
jgi:23S rRNA (cytosine1962-C5)-methyltransferase